MRRPMQAEGFQRISVKLCKSRRLPAYKKPTTLRTYKLVDFSLSILTHQNPRNARCSWSVPPVTISTLVSYVTYLSLIIFKIIPHPMTLLTAFPLQVIIPYLILYRLLSLNYCRITYPLSSSHIPSPRVRPTRHLNPFS
jgi:hypothetical protein